MTPIACTTCAARVQARKSSWDQTTIQWTDAAVASCVERRTTPPRPGPNGATFLRCSALALSVREAAVTGVLPVQDPDDYRSNDAADHAAGEVHAR